MAGPRAARSSVGDVTSEVIAALDSLKKSRLFIDLVGSHITGDDVTSSTLWKNMEETW